MTARTVLDLTSVFERVRWAHQHAIRAVELTDAWAKGAIERSISDPPEDGFVRYTATVIVIPGADISLALGDMLHNARASLDCLVTALRGQPSERTQFLITRDPAKFDADSPVRLDGVPDWAVDAIRAVQPFPDNPWRHVGESLERLHLLAIRDRHRALLLRVGLIDLDQVSASTSDAAEVSFGLIEGGRTLTIDYPTGAVVIPSVGAEVYVDEVPARWLDTAYPPTASVAEIAHGSMWAVDQALQMVMRAATQNGVGHDRLPTWYPTIRLGAR